LDEEDVREPCPTKSGFKKKLKGEVVTQVERKNKRFQARWGNKSSTTTEINVSSILKRTKKKTPKGRAK